MFENILVVCIGNICRSPVAEALLKDALINKVKKDYKISSAGLGAMVGHQPDKTVCELMLEKGIDISDYRAAQLNQEMIYKSDLILVMETAHKELIEHKEPSAKGKVFKLGEWRNFEIPDPYRQERKVFEEVVQLIEKGVQDWVSKI
ncbi:MAG: low molecular weight phosphotyrosine protein phosphatase [Methyloprofundus sp.]|nr:low molecular weight phosphotyrosine protein phosphatase [Methyloprofundus sp.]